MTAQVGIEMPQYECHKKVWALKIKEVNHKPNPDESGFSCASSYGAMLIPEDARYGAIEVDANYDSKHKPEAGGYFVVYEDGYLSYSPAKAFEEGYSLI